MATSTNTSRGLFPGALQMMILDSLRQPARAYETSRAGLQHLEREISSFDRMLVGVQMVLGPERRTANS